MIETKRCPICHEFPTLSDYTFGAHRCKPFFLCRFDWQTDEEEDPKKIFADSEQDAAERFVTSYDEDDCGLTEDSDVIVSNPRDEKNYKVHVTGEVMRIYRASRPTLEEISAGGSEP